jgi:hypothetical protein
MVNVLLDVVVPASSLILFGDPQFLIEQACDRGDATNKRVSTMESMTQNLFSICKNMPRNTKALQIARAIVVASGSQNNLDRSFADSENIDPPRFGRTARGTAPPKISKLLRMGPIQHERKEPVVACLMRLLRTL